MLTGSLEQLFPQGVSPLSAGSDAPSALSDSANSESLLLLDMCRNYSCCGLALLDLHELVDHFEEKHVIVVDNKDAAELVAAGGSVVAGDKELDKEHQRAPAYSGDLVVFYPLEFAARRVRPAARPTFTPDPAHRQSRSQLLCASPAVLLSHSSSALLTAIPRAPSPDPPRLTRRASKLNIATVEGAAESKRRPSVQAYKCPMKGWRTA